MACLAAGILLWGCESLPRHEVDVHQRLIENPVSSVLILPPSVPLNIERAHPDDFEAWKDETREATVRQLSSLVLEAISSSVTAESARELDQGVRDWADAIGKDLLMNRVALSVDPVALEAEAVLVWAVVRYGTELNQLNFQLIPFLKTRKKYFGRASYNHLCELEALLIRPSDGAILFHVCHEAKAKSEKRDPDLLLKLARECAWTIPRGLPPRQPAPPGAP